MKFSEFTIHTVLATFPQGQEIEFDEKIKKEYYEDFQTKSLSFLAETEKEKSFFSESGNGVKTAFLFNPIRYHILGNYDIAYIALINNLKFAQRLFESSPDNGKDNTTNGAFTSHTFQSLTGITHMASDDLKSFFINQLTPKSTKRKYFLGICNLKLNNGILIGAGGEFIKSAISLIKEYVSKLNEGKKAEDKFEIIIQQSFSWFEFTLLIFTNNPDDIAQLLIDLRKATIENINNAKDIADNSLYKELYGETIENLDHVSVFTDTHTYIGMHTDLICPTSSDQEFMNKFLEKADSIKLQTQIEWQIKPGHLKQLVYELNKHFENKETGFDFTKKYLLTGKSDYLLLEKGNSVKTNWEVFRLLYNKPNPILKNIRKIRTRVLFERAVEILTEPKKREILNLQEKLHFLTINSSKIREIETALKEMKISRLIKSKILKIFTNYNNGIQDPILFPFFLDFCLYMEDLARMIRVEKNEWLKLKTQKTDFKIIEGDISKIQDYQLISVDDLEKKLMKRIRDFEDAFTLRMMNCYQFEDITDFDLDFNASVQQLLSLYSSIVIEIANLFYEPDQKNKVGLLVQLNLKDTQANYTSINYHVHHLISPEFVFATITKEILNNEIYDNSILKRIKVKYDNHISNFKTENPKIFELIKLGDLDILYFINDIVRFAVTYDFNLELFSYWFWSYNLQNSLLFDKRGVMNERHFKKELIRFLLVKKFYEMTDNSISCPIPEIATYWDRHYHELNEIACEYITMLEKIDLLKEIIDYFISHFKQFTTYLCPEKTIEEPKTYDDKDKIKKLSKVIANGGRLLESPKNYYALNESYQNFLVGKINTITLNQKLYFTMRKHLQIIFEANNKNIFNLRRDWETGKPLKSFISATAENHLYCIDQTGGIFFDNLIGLNSYAKINNNLIFELLDISLRLKKSFIVSRRNN